MPPNGPAAAMATCEAEKALSSSSSSLPDALIVPGLASACCEASTVRTMRLVSRGVKDAVHTAVQGYTLRLEISHRPDHMVHPQLLSFLNSCQLQRLHILVPDVSEHESSLSAVTETLAATLCTFLTMAGPAIRSVTHLTISVALPASNTHHSNSNNTTTTATTNILHPLVTAFPQLASLSIKGHVGCSLLQQFGSSCPKLTHFTSTLTHLSPTTRKQLSTLLPHMTSLAALPSQNKSIGRGELDTLALREVLAFCPGLLSLSIFLHALTNNLWMVLPKGLQSLSCSLNANANANPWQTHEGLRNMDVTGENVSFPLLVELVDAAPNADICYSGGKDFSDTLQVGCSRSEAKALQILDHNLQIKKLLLSSFPPFGSDDAMALQVPSLWFHAGNDEKQDTYDGDASDGDKHEHPMGVFLSTHMHKPLPSFRVVGFVDDQSEGWEEEKRCGDLSHLHRVFPNIRELSVESISFGTSEDVASLIKCLSLQKLSLDKVEGFNEEDVSALCRGSESLREVKLLGCRSVCLQWGRRIEAKGGKVFGVQVSIDRGQDLEAEDDEEDADEWAQSH